MLAELEQLESHLGGVADMKRQSRRALVIDLRKEADRRARGEPARPAGHRPRRHELRPGRGRLRHPGNDDAIRLRPRDQHDRRRDRGGKAEGQGRRSSSRPPRKRPSRSRRASAARGLARREPTAEEQPEAEAALKPAARSPQSPSSLGARPKPQTFPRPQTASRAAAKACRPSRRRRRCRPNDRDLRRASSRTLRDMTGAPMMDCKRALQDADGDIEAAKQLLRERGMAQASKRAGQRDDRGRRARLGSTTRWERSSRSAPRPSPSRRTRSSWRSPSACSRRSRRVALTRFAPSRRSAPSSIGKIGENIAVARRRPIRVRRRRAIAAYVHPPANKIGVLVQRRGRTRRGATGSRCTSPSRLLVFATRDEVPEDEIANERSIYEKLPEVESKPEQARAEDRRGHAREALLRGDRAAEQAWIHEPKKTVAQALEEEGAEGARVRALRPGRVTVQEESAVATGDAPAGLRPDPAQALRRGADGRPGVRPRPAIGSRSIAREIVEVPRRAESRSRSSSAAGTSTGAWPARPRAWTARRRTTPGCSRRC